MSKARPVQIQLFLDQPVDMRERQLEQARRKLSRGDIDRDRKLTRQALREKIERARFKPQSRGSSELLDDIFLDTGVNLDDGMLRLVMVNKWGGVEVWNGERFGHAMFGHLSKTVRGGKVLIKLKAGTQTFPWKYAWYTEAVITRVEWIEEEGQYKVFIPSRQSPRVGVTYWFRPRYKKARQGKNWKEPRQTSKTVPLK